MSFLYIACNVKWIYVKLKKKQIEAINGNFKCFIINILTRKSEPGI